MRIDLFIGFLFVTISFLACSSESKDNDYGAENTDAMNEQEERQAIVGNNIAMHAPKDTFEVNGRSMIFYMISEKELKALQVAKQADGMYEQISEFYTEATEVIKKMPELKATSMVTDKRFFSFELANGESKVFDRYTSGKFFGAVLFDGENTPEIHAGIKSEKEFRALADKSFKQ